MRIRIYTGTKKQACRDLLKTVGILSVTVLLTELLFYLGVDDQHLDLVYSLSMLVIARYTNGYFFGVMSAFVGALSFNFFITEPRMGFNFARFPVAFIVMLSVSLISCTLTTQMKNSFAKQQSMLINFEKERIRGILLRAISHDLRTPLTGILSASSIIEEQAGSLERADIQDIASNIKLNSEWLIRMVENLLAVTRISDGTVKVQKTMEFAEEIMAQSTAIVRRRFPICNIHLKAPEEPLLVCVDPMLISQVFINLLDNAVKYSPSTLPVEFTLYKDDGFARFEIADQGRGIPTQIIDQLFEKYIPSMDQNTDSASGMGIGLSICKTIIDSHGGKITVKNKQEGGTVVNVILPLK